MEMVKEFLINNWQLIASSVLFLIAVIVGSIQKLRKGYTISDVLNGLITEELPNWINLSETAGTSEQKKVKVLNYALSFASKKLGRQLTESEVAMITTYTSEQIEKILTTPQKKDSVEVKKGGKKHASYRQ